MWTRTYYGRPIGHSRGTQVDIFHLSPHSFPSYRHRVLRSAARVGHSLPLVLRVGPSSPCHMCVLELFGIEYDRVHVYCGAGRSGSMEVSITPLLLPSPLPRLQEWLVDPSANPLASKLSWGIITGALEWTPLTIAVGMVGDGGRGGRSSRVVRS